MSESFEWYCENCGYLPGSRVTFHETCDLCHVPVVLHNREVRDAEIERLTRDRDIAERKAAVCREDAEINARRAESAEAEVERLKAELEAERRGSLNRGGELARVEALVAELEAALQSIATEDQDDRPLPGESGAFDFDWRRRSEKQEQIARRALLPGI